jgi:hypothetical protein
VADVRQNKVRNVYFPFYLIIVPVPVFLAAIKNRNQKITEILFHKPNKLQSVFDFRLN